MATENGTVADYADAKPETVNRLPADPPAAKPKGKPKGKPDADGDDDIGSAVSLYRQMAKEKNLGTKLRTKVREDGEVVTWSGRLPHVPASGRLVDVEAAVGDGATFTPTFDSPDFDKMHGEKLEMGRRKSVSMLRRLAAAERVKD